jgi:hypothetical protein
MTIKILLEPIRDMDNRVEAHNMTSPPSSSQQHSTSCFNYNTSIQQPLADHVATWGLYPVERCLFIHHTVHIPVIRGAPWYPPYWGPHIIVSPPYKHDATSLSSS